MFVNRPPRFGVEGRSLRSGNVTGGERKHMRHLRILVLSVMMAACPAAAWAANYDAGDIAVIDRLFTDNGLTIGGWTLNTPGSWNRNGGDSSTKGINWDTANPDRIVLVNVDNSGLTGDASFVGLTSLQKLYADNNASLTSLNLQGLTNLQEGTSKNYRFSRMNSFPLKQYL